MAPPAPLRVMQVFRKPQLGQPVTRCDRLVLRRGYGIEGDANAEVGCPRQVLLVDWPTLQAFDLQPGDLRENLLVEGTFAQLASGQVWQVGTARLRLTFLCEPCAALETVRPGLVKAIRDRRGWLSVVVQSGVVAPGDTLTLRPERLPPTAPTPKGRFCQFVARIPPGQVVTTADVLLAIGVSRAYYRVLPRWLQANAPHLPCHRVVSRAGTLLTAPLPDQAAQLRAEGVSLIENRVDLAQRWPAEQFQTL